jgi:hypothetical protein
VVKHQAKALSSNPSTTKKKENDVEKLKEKKRSGQQIKNQVIMDFPMGQTQMTILQPGLN